jgi:hypothetical protein
MPIQRELICLAELLARALIKILFNHVVFDVCYHMNWGSANQGLKVGV